ncbi:MAG TPA: PmoA family protein [Pilimelia sp.]|nr:PmoA family protein [Pilimelia sp.]
MGAETVELRLGGRPVAAYVIDPDLDAKHGPRPYLHPVHTLAGVPVTDALPEDHVWHLGASLAVQDVSGTNLWGGRTYVRDAGYTWLDDHGRIAHLDWVERADDRLVHRLAWQDRAGETLLHEERLLAAQPVAGRADAWALDVAYTLTAPADRDISLGSPATNGRPGGTGYGGFFWRAAPGPAAPEVFSADHAGEDDVNGSTEAWVALVGPAYTLIFTGLGEGDHWFVRASMYPGVCAAFAFDRPRLVAAGASLLGQHRVLVADGRLDRTGVTDLLAAALP